MQQRPQDEARPVLALAKPGAGSGFGSRFPLAKTKQGRFWLQPNRVQSPPLAFISRQGNLRNWKLGGRWPSIQDETPDSSGIGPERPGALARVSPGRPRSPFPSSVSLRIIPFPAVSPKRSAAETWAGTRTTIRRLLPVGPLGGVSSQRLGPESRSASVDSPGRARSPFPSSVSLRA